MSLGILKIFSYCMAPFGGLDPHERTTPQTSKDSVFSNLLTKIKTFLSSFLSKTPIAPPKEDKLAKSRITVITPAKEQAELEKVVLGPMPKWGSNIDKFEDDIRQADFTAQLLKEHGEVDRIQKRESTEVSGPKKIRTKKSDFQSHKAQIEEMFPGYTPLTAAEIRKDRALRHYSLLNNLNDDAYLNR